MVRCHVDLDAPRQPAPGVDHRDHRIHLLGRSGDHCLLRCGIYRHREIRVVGDQLLGGGRIQFQQRHRALPGQPRHQPGPGGDHFQPVGGAQRPGHHRRGHLPHRMPDHRIGFHPIRAPQGRQRQLHPDQAPAGYAQSPPPAHRRPTPAAAKTLPARQTPAPARRPPRRTPAHRPATPGPYRATANPDRNTGIPCQTRTHPDVVPPPPALGDPRPAPATRPPPVCGPPRTPWRTWHAADGDS